VDCTTAQEFVTEHADGRSLEGDTRRELDVHLAACAPCRTALAAERAIKRGLHSRLAGKRMPAASALRITDLIEEQALLDEAATPTRPVSFIGALARRPVLAIGLAATVILVILFAVPPKGGTDRRYNVAGASLISEMLSTFDNASNGRGMQIASSSADEISRFFALRGMSFAPTVRELGMARLVGARVIDHQSARIAEVLYKCGSNTIVVQQFAMSDISPANALSLTDSARQCVCNGQWYWYSDDRKIQVGIWKSGEILCATASDCDLAELQSLLRQH
jgi:hypothetical protein